MEATNWSKKGASLGVGVGSRVEVGSGVEVNAGVDVNSGVAVNSAVAVVSGGEVNVSDPKISGVAVIYSDKGVALGLIGFAEKNALIL
jgi:hypothetical protein